MPVHLPRWLKPQLLLETAMKKQRKLIRNAPKGEEDEAAIAHGIASDPDAFEPTDEQFAQTQRRAGLPELAHPKIAVTVRYDADILDQFKAGGEGWQTRMNNALREWRKAHRA
jgi:uncharacterized protein (DUF4415 family)